jgi:maltooligosyltrehalose trehalohydrolase
LGAVPAAEGGTRFQVWAPTTHTVDLVVASGTGTFESRPLTALATGHHTARFADLGPGTRYGYRLDGDGPFPDPASRQQPDGVHGLSCVVDPGRFRWSDTPWTGVALADLVIYELHVGTFTPQGTFAAAAAKLDELRRLGVTAIELMPVADFPGLRNWGYDGAALFAPARCYGSPDDLRAFVDAAHGQGLAVIFDVVYNHAGPDGAYLARFSPYYFTTRHASPWGAGLDLDGPHSAHVRAFFSENALHWIHEYHGDGLRLDATHAIQDDSPRHFLAELSARVHDTTAGRHVHVIAEDHRNLAGMVTPVADGGWGLDAVWADDFHHEVRRLLAGDRDGYYRDFTGTVPDIAETIRHGWFFAGQYSAHLGAPRGTDPSALEPQRFVVCLQNHDQIGNRALGERLHHQISWDAYRAATVLLLLGPQTPLLFMGQEWGATSPFLYFTDHLEPLGRLVTEGRRREFATFTAFADAEARSRIPDPQAAATFEASRLDWRERASEPHASLLRLYREVLSIRQRELMPANADDARSARALDDDTLVVRRRCRNGDHAVLVVRLRGTGVSVIDAGGGAGWRCRLTSEDAAFSQGSHPPTVDVGTQAGVAISCSGPAAVLLIQPASASMAAR